MSYIDGTLGAWAFTEYESPRPLTDEEIKLLRERTEGDWWDGVGAAFFEHLRDSLGLPVLLNWRGPLRLKQFPREKWRFAGWCPLARACWRGNLEMARAALADGGDPNAHCPDGLPVLHVAILGGHADLAQLLVEHGADVRAPDVLDLQRTPLWTCVTRECKTAVTVRIARMLLERGANPTGGYRDSPLDVARRRNWDRMASLLDEFLSPFRGLDGSGLPFRAGDRARICSGPFNGVLGWVEQDVSTDSIDAKVRIDLFGQSVVMDLPADTLYSLVRTGEPRSLDQRSEAEPDRRGV